MELYLRQTIVQQIVELENSPTAWATISYTDRVTRLNNLLAEIDQVLQLAAMEAAGTLQTTLEQLIPTESALLTQKFNQLFRPISIPFSELPYAQLEKALTIPLMGETLAEKTAWMSRRALQAVKNDLVQSILTGEDMRRAAERLFLTGQKLGGIVGNKIVNSATFKQFANSARLYQLHWALV